MLRKVPSQKVSSKFSSSVNLKSAAAKNSSENVKEIGSVLVELTLVVPLMAMMLFLIWDLGNSLITYVRISHVASEGARLASSLSDLESLSGGGLYEDLHNGGACPDAASCPQWTFVHNRVNNLLELNSIELTDIHISSEMLNEQLAATSGGSSTAKKVDDNFLGPNTNPNPTPPPPATYDTVQITVSGTHESFFGLLGNLPITFEVRAPYLSRSSFSGEFIPQLPNPFTP